MSFDSTDACDFSFAKLQYEIENNVFDSIPVLSQTLITPQFEERLQKEMCLQTINQQSDEFFMSSNNSSTKLPFFDSESFVEDYEYFNGELLSNEKFANELSVKSTATISHSNEKLNFDIQDFCDDKLGASLDQFDNAQEQVQETEVLDLSHFVDNQDKSQLSIDDKIARLVQSQTSQEMDLAQRRDVVNKTVLRVLRRFFTQAFKDMFPKDPKCKLPKSAFYIPQINEFCSTLFGENNAMLREIQFFMASIINPNFATKDEILSYGFSCASFEIFHSCLYKYSHTKLISLLKVKPLSAIYEYFFNGALSDIVKSEPSVCKNPQLYNQAFQDFYEIMVAGSDASTPKLY